jgi:hypothetical protein
MLYIWRLATFLRSNNKEMSAEELVDHLNRNGFTTQRGTEHVKAGHGPYRIISATWHWINDDLGLHNEAENVALAYVKPDGTHAWA